jgi:putative transposase
MIPSSRAFIPAPWPAPGVPGRDPHPALIHKARNVIERLPKPLHASVRRALRQAWELDDADKAERLLRNLARRLDQEAPSVAASIFEGLDKMLTVNRLSLPVKLRRSLLN